MSLLVLMANGILSQAECAELHRAYSDPSFSFVTRSTFAAWGKKRAS